MMWTYNLECNLVRLERMIEQVKAKLSHPNNFERYHVAESTSPGGNDHHHRYSMVQEKAGMSFLACPFHTRQTAFS